MSEASARTPAGAGSRSGAASPSGARLPSGGPGPAAALLVCALLVAGCADRDEVSTPLPVGGPETAEYPLDLWDRGVEGETLIRLKVERTGEVDSVEVAETSGHAAFDSAAVRWGREARFSPAVRGADTVAVWARVPVRFQRNDVPPEPEEP